MSRNRRGDAKAAGSMTQTASGVRRGWLLRLVVTLSAFSLVVPSLAAGQPVPETSCPAPPADFEPPLPNDAAIETRHLRQDLAASCEATAERQELVSEQVDDIRRFTGWSVGVVLVLISVPVLRSIVRSGN